MLTTLALMSALAMPTPLTTMTADDPLYGGGDAYALSGDTAFFTRTRGREVRVYAMPVTGGAPRRVFSHRVPPEVIPSPILKASPQRVALSVEYLTPRGEFDFRIFSGPPTGPWTRVAPLAPRQGIPPTVAVDGDRLITLEHVDKQDVLAVRDGAVVHRLPVPDQDGGSRSAVIAGDLIAFAEEHRLVIRNWRTGADLATPTFTGFPDWIALAPDGRAAVVTGPESLYDVLPGGVPRRVRGIGWAPVLAGPRIVYRDNSGLKVQEPDGTVRPFGIATRRLESFTADERHVLWTANGCLLVAPVEAPIATAPAAGPCARVELALPEQRSQRLQPTLRVVVGCVSAPGACAGTLRLTAGEGGRAVSSARRFSIPAGAQRAVRVRLTRPGQRLLAAAIRRDRGVIVSVRAQIDGHAVNATGGATVLR